MDIFLVLKMEFGTLKKFANALGVTPTSVHRWKRDGFPVGKLKEIEKLTEGKITKEMMRPDLFKRD